MLLQFKTEDDAIFLTDVQFMTWARVSAPAADQESKVVEHGRLVPQGFGIYAFEGRTPKTEGPGAGLCSIGNYVVAIGQAVKIFLRANVPVKDFTMPVPIRQVLYEILPTDPQQIQNSIQEVADAGQDSKQGQETAPAAQEPASGGTIPGGEPQAEQPSSEAGVQLGNEAVGEQVDLVEQTSL
jgi:hypothetical protein